MCNIGGAKIKNLIILTGLFLLVLIMGCSKSEQELINFNPYDLNDELNDDFTFDYHLPTKLPFEVEDYKVEPLPNQKRFTIVFKGVDDKSLILTIVKGEVHSSGELDEEQVNINNRQGKYVKNEHGAKILSWRKDNINYKLVAGEELSKPDLKKTAESFKLSKELS